MKRLALIVALVTSTSFAGEMLKPVPFTDVKLTDTFWAPRQQVNRAVTIPHNFKMCENTGRISNFDKAAGRLAGKFEGLYFNDSDVYKVMEAAAYSLATHPDPQLDAYLDKLIEKIAAAQKPDGYLNTYYTLTGYDKRWTDLGAMHEMYCAGHLIEAAVAHYQATGKRNFLEVAIKLADHIDSIFGPGKRAGICGHEEIEIALIKLHGATGQKRYLDLARFMIDLRGRGEGRKRFGEYAQDHKPLVDQDKAVGHAVRFGYFATGASDLVLATGEPIYVPALRRLWENVSSAKLYVTGGIGARHSGEAFGEDFELPNESAYAETCAGIANAMWNHRMNLIEADAKYADVLERVLYNGFLSGVSLSGDTFFYVNPLASRGKHHRTPWFGCACCPPNVARVMASLGGYVYATSGDAAYVNLYAASEAKLTLAGKAVVLKQRTNYPWDGEIRLSVESQGPVEATIALRIPAWHEGEAMVRVNNAPIQAAIERGYARITRTWRSGDEIALSLKMEPRRVYADPRVKANTGRVAVARGPIVYAIEGADNGFHFPSFYLPKDAPLKFEASKGLLDGVTVIVGRGKVRKLETESDADADFVAVPYYAWDNRDAGAMAVWLAESRDLAKAKLPPTIASQAKATVSFRGNGDGPEAINDQLEPVKSNDHDVARHTFWPHKGTKEWAQIVLKAKTRVSAVSVYWFDDTGSGECRVPASWKLLCRDGQDWKPVINADDYGTSPDRYNTVRFAPVETDALRIEIQLKEKMSAGILEWKVE